MLGTLSERILRRIYLANLRGFLQGLSQTEIPDWLLEHQRRMPSDSDVQLIKRLMRGTPRAGSRSTRSRARYVRTSARIASPSKVRPNAVIAPRALRRSGSAGPQHGSRDGVRSSGEL